MNGWINRLFGGVRSMTQSSAEHETEQSMNTPVKQTVDETVDESANRPATRSSRRLLSRTRSGGSTIQNDVANSTSTADDQSNYLSADAQPNKRARLSEPALNSGRKRSAGRSTSRSADKVTQPAQSTESLSEQPSDLSTSIQSKAQSSLPQLTQPASVSTSTQSELQKNKLAESTNHLAKQTKQPVVYDEETESENESNGEADDVSDNDVEEDEFVNHIASDSDSDESDDDSDWDDLTVKQRRARKAKQAKAAALVQEAQRQSAAKLEAAKQAAKQSAMVQGSIMTTPVLAQTVNNYNQLIKPVVASKVSATAAQIVSPYQKNAQQSSHASHSSLSQAARKSPAEPLTHTDPSTGRPITQNNYNMMMNRHYLQLQAQEQAQQQAQHLQIAQEIARLYAPLPPPTQPNSSQTNIQAVNQLISQSPNPVSGYSSTTSLCNQTPFNPTVWNPSMSNDQLAAYWSGYNYPYHNQAYHPAYNQSFGQPYPPPHLSYQQSDDYSMANQASHPPIDKSPTSFTNHPLPSSPPPLEAAPEPKTKLEPSSQVKSNSTTNQAINQSASQPKQSKQLTDKPVIRLVDEPIDLSTVPVNRTGITLLNVKVQSGVLLSQSGQSVPQPTDSDDESDIACQCETDAICRQQAIDQSKKIVDSLLQLSRCMADEEHRFAVYVGGHRALLIKQVVSA